ncbi:MAG: LPS export ABC transporter periplasmic protein LptC [Xenococcaceae cyanobacterium]
MNWWVNPTQIKLLVGSVARGFLLILLLSASACQEQSQLEQKLKQDPATTSKLESSLILNNATLEQSNAQGQTLWKIKAQQAVYSQDQKTAQLEKLTVIIFQDGKIVLQVSAQKGEIQKDGEEIFLKGKIIATDPRNEAVIRGEAVEWHPQEDLLIVRQNLTGSHPKLKLSAKQGRYFTRTQRLELIGEIVATAQDPSLQMKTEHLSWEIPQQKVIGDRPLQIVRYKDKTITDQVLADRFKVYLNNNIVVFQQNVELKSLDPPVQIASNSVIWNFKLRTIKSDKPVQIVHSQDKVIITANQGQVDLEQEVAHLKGGVQGISSRNQIKLYSNELIWNIPTQIVEALGNVIYEQADPPFNLTGTKAVGKLKDNSVVVSSNSGDRVVTEIIP